jgi:uncharacterized protein
VVILPDSIISSGKTVEEAVLTALKILKANKKECKIEVLDRGKSRMFGIGSTPSVVKVTKRKSVSETIPLESYEKLIENILENPEPSSQENAVVNGQEGTVWLSNGRVYCKDTNTDLFPTITPDKNIELIVNGERIIEKTVLQETDIVKINLPNEKREGSWNITLNKNESKATLFVKPAYTKSLTLIDQKPTQHLKISPEESIKRHNPIQVAHIKNKLKELNVTFGINESEILKASKTEDDGEFTVAEGKEPVQGKDGWLELKIEEHTKENLQENDDGTMDFREKKVIPSVEDGQIIGIIHDPIQGTAGFSVTSNVILPRPVKQLRMGKRKGNQLNGNTIIATMAGRPQIEIRGSIINLEIMPKLVHYDNVDLESGNLRFNGDIEVVGYVDEKMTVDTRGDVFIHEYVSGANISARNAMEIKGNVIRSSLKAGEHNLVIAKLSNLLEELLYQLKKVIFSIEQIFTSPVYKSMKQTFSLHATVHLLLEKMFKDFKGTVQQFVTMVYKSEKLLDKEWKSVASNLYKGFLILHRESLNEFSELKDLSLEMSNLLEAWQTPDVFNSQVILPYALNSEIYCSGNVYITGDGCYNSKVHSEGILEIKGFLRGGDVYAAKGIFIEEAGSIGGVRTKIKVDEQAEIKINYALDGTRIQIGKKAHVFHVDTHHVHAKLIGGVLDIKGTER